MEETRTSASVDVALAEVRNYLERPYQLLDYNELMFRVTHLASVARDSGDIKASEYRAVLGELEKRKSLPAEAFHHIVAVLGDPVQAKIARQISGVLKTQMKLDDPARDAPRQRASYGASRASAPLPTSRRSAMRCFTCGLPGHFARECVRNRPYSRARPWR